MSGLIFVNSAPTFELKANSLEVDEDAVFQSSSGPDIPFVLNISNGPGEIQNITFTVVNVSKYAHLFLVPPKIDSKGVLSFELVPNAFGQTNFSVSAKNSGGIDIGGVDTSTPKIFTFIVKAVNDPPIFQIQPSAGPYYMNTDSNISEAGFVFNISLGNQYEQGQDVTFAVALSSGTPLASNMLISRDGALSFTLIGDTYGKSQYMVTAVDSGNGANTSEPKRFNLTVLWRNQAPSFSLSKSLSNNTLVVREDSDCKCDCGYDGLCCYRGNCTMQVFARNISTGPNLAEEATQSLSFVLMPAAGAGGLRSRHK